MEEIVKEWSMLVAQHFTALVMAVVGVVSNLFCLVLLSLPLWVLAWFVFLGWIVFR